MEHRSPTREGFRAVLRQPSLALAEIAWRWSFGAAAGLLLGLSFLEYMDTLPVTAGDLLFLRSRQSFLISQALAHMLYGSALRLVAAALVLLAALAVVWILAASVGRAATLRGLLDFRAHGNATPPRDPVGEGAWRLRSLLGLNFLRVALTLAAVLACTGAMIVASFAFSDADQQPGRPLLIFLPFAFLVWLLWSALNWLLSLASIFVVRDGHDTLGAVSAAVGLCRDRTGPVLAVGTWFGLGHGMAFILASSIIFVALALAAAPPGGALLGVVLLVTLAYFAIVDFLFMGRLAAYLSIVEGPAPESAQPSALSIAPRNCVDPDELILSDLAGLADAARGNC